MRFSELGFQWYSVVNTESSEDTRLLVVIWSCVGDCCSTSSMCACVCVRVYIHMYIRSHGVCAHDHGRGARGVSCAAR